MRPASPAILTADATERLPRWVLLLLGLLYIAPGLLGREAWKPIDGTSLGIMLELVNGHADWWSPTLLGQSVAEAAWLPYWLGAWAIQALPFLDPVTASRVPLAAALVLTMVSTWYASFSLALQPLAQPVRFAFGGHAEPLNYARAIADTALLALVACLGLAIMGHESSPHPYAMAASAALLHVAADAQRASPALKPARWTLRWAIAVVVLMASGYPGTAVCLGLLALWPAGTDPASSVAKRAGLLRGAIAVALFALYWGVPWPHDAASSAPWRLAHLAGWLRTSAWYAWPAWPLAGIALWTWRRQWRSAHIALPLAASLILMLIAVGAAVPQRHMLLLLPALAPLAAFAVPTVKRHVMALVDWLALLMFSVTGTVIAVYGLAMGLGWPAPAARAVRRLLPELRADIPTWVWLFAVVITAAWLGAVRWRTRSHRPALWKSLVLSAAGTTWCWALLMSLWLPALNHGMSYRHLAERLAQLTPPGACLRTAGFAPALNAALLQQGIRPVAQADTSTCDYLAVGEYAEAFIVDAQTWVEMASLWQVDQRAQRVLLFKRLSSAAAP